MVENPAMQDKIGLYLTSQQLDMQYKFDPFRSQEEHLVVLQAFADWYVCMMMSSYALLTIDTLDNHAQ